MNKCRGMLWKQRGLENRVTCSCKIRGSRRHCIDLHNRACILLGQKQACAGITASYITLEGLLQPSGVANEATKLAML